MARATADVQSLETPSIFGQAEIQEALKPVPAVPETAPIGIDG